MREAERARRIVRKGASRVLLISALTAVVIPAFASDRGRQGGAFAAAIDSLIAVAPNDDVDTTALRRLYALGGLRPLWTRDGRATEQAREMLAFMDSSSTRGLDPADYHTDSLRVLLAAVQQGTSHTSADSTHLAVIDMHVSRALLRLLAHLDHGRIRAASVGFHIPSRQPERDLPAIAASITESKAVSEVLASVEPQYAGYSALIQLLAQYRALARDSAIVLTARRVPLTKRVRQIELALERWRWLPAQAPARYVVVNIPAFRLYAFENDARAERPVLSMNVVVGEAEGRHHTPVFVGEMREVVFRPYWDVPLRIARTELVPAIRRGRVDMQREGYEIVTTGDSPRALPVTRANLDRVAAGTLRLRQRPGNGNALGLVKFVFPNDHNVYMHGTPAVHLFRYVRRDFSHGCIRVEQPTALASFALDGDDTWSAEAIENAMHGERTLRVPLAEPVSVFILYMTAIVAPDGTAYFYPDLYGEDARLEQTLGRR